MIRSARTLSILGLLLVFALVATQCVVPATPAAPEAPAEPAEAEAPEEEAAPAEEPEVSITYATQQTTVTLDPGIHVDETESFHVMNIYEPLVWPAKGGAPQPHLAESWEVSDDGLTYTFKLKEGVKFHDGAELTAEDVAFSMDRMLSLGKGFSWLWQDVLDVGDVEAVDDYTVAFHLNEPYGPFLSTLVQFFVVNKDLLMENKEDGDYGEFGDYGQAFLNQQDAGSGPYYVDVYEPGTKTVFRKFDDYWGGWEPGQVTKATFLIVSELATQKLMLQKGEVDFIEQWHSVESFEELKQSEGVVVEEDPRRFPTPLTMARRRMSSLEAQRKPEARCLSCCRATTRTRRNTPTTWKRLRSTWPPRASTRPSTHSATFMWLVWRARRRSGCCCSLTSRNWVSSWRCSQSRGRVWWNWRLSLTPRRTSWPSSTRPSTRHRMVTPT
jgi:ABC-type transport system substrate-binding protein